jgi:hypothetical protein
MRVPRTKNNQSHAVPLNDTAYATLKRLYAARDTERDSPYIFVLGWLPAESSCQGKNCSLIVHRHLKRSGERASR